MKPLDACALGLLVGAISCGGSDSSRRATRDAGPESGSSAGGAGDGGSRSSGGAPTAGSGGAPTAGSGGRGGAGTSGAGGISARDGGTDASQDSGPGEGGSCRRGQVSCDGGCIPVHSDTTNCGACGVTCNAAATCWNGECVVPVASDVGTTCDPSARIAFPAIVTPVGVYLVQGIPVNVATPLSTTSLINFESDGGLVSTCTASTDVTVPVAEYAMGVVRAADSVYLIGGATSSSTQTAVYRARVGSAGLSSFSVATVADGGAPVALQTSRYGAAVVQSGNHVYVIGGWSGATNTGVGQDISAIERAELDLATGDFLTSFEPAIDPNTSAQAAMAHIRFNAAVFQGGSWVYVLGGQTGVGPAVQVHDEIQRARLDENGNLSTFIQVGTLPTPLVSPAVFAAGGTLYLLGGATGYTQPSYATTAAVLQARILNDGSLGEFTTSSLTLSYPVAGAGTAHIDRTLYIIEGLRDGFSATTSVQAITIPGP